MWCNDYETEEHLLQKCLLHYKVGQVLQIGARAITKWRRLFITKWVNRYCKVGYRYYQVGRLYCKVGQLLQKRPVHLRDTRTNGNPYLPTGSMWFENGILRNFNFRKTFNKAISFNVCFQEAKIC